MSALYARYVAGEHEAVWAALGTGPVPSPDRTEGEAIALATMRRVRRNVEALVARLGAAGYPFEHPLAPAGADAFARYRAVFAPPAPNTPAVLDEIEGLAGALPLSVRAWYQEVGAVNLQAAEPQAMALTTIP